MIYKGQCLKEISFPLGGIGTGCVGLGGDGRLIDWEIFNRPSKGSINGYSHFAIRAIKGDTVTAKVLNTDVQKDFTGQYERKNGHLGFGFGPSGSKMGGFPHFKNAVFTGEFPMASIAFTDAAFPASVTMTAFNPFIPCDAKNSSVPAAFFAFEVENTTDETIKYQIAFSLANPFEASVNQASEKDGYKVLTFRNAAADRIDPAYGDLTIATDGEGVQMQTYWYRGGWRDSIVSFWNDFSSAGALPERLYDTEGCFDHGTLLAEAEIAPKQKKCIRFILAWNVPQTYNYWYKGEEEEVRKPWKNYYATVFEDSAHTAAYGLTNWETLFSRTLAFKNALHSSTLPAEVIDAASSNLAVLKSPTVLRLEDGSFYGWEGVGEFFGSCEGTCQHVWNYAYGMCFLFPALERSIRDTEFRYSTDKTGRMGFRTLLPLGREMTKIRACVDGQMGAVIKCYREWKISGDNTWLRAQWDNIKKVLEYAWSEENEDGWDLDKDGVLEGRQHHTLDMELFGPSSWLEGMYLLALKAAHEMGMFLGDTEKAAEYLALYEKGYRWTKENLFSGRYFIQKTDVTDKKITDRYNASETYWNAETKEIKYQIAEGSSIDQLLAQWHADILGLGSIFDKTQISVALSEMMQHNYKESMRDFVNPWRLFSLNDEAGTVICAYPDGVKKPKIPIPYCEETMTGFEYAFAGLLCAEGRFEDGMAVTKAVRDRFDGEKRNPWNEFECGSNYARSMASYALVPILSGFAFDMPKHHIGFNPYKKDDFKCIWSLADGWGTFEMKHEDIKLCIQEGSLTLASFGIPFCKDVQSVRIDGEKIDFVFADGKIKFEKTTVCRSVEITV